MFEHFDFSALEDPAFKEDSVREEIIAPLLRRLGYSPAGEPRVVRSKALTHPFVMIGSKKHGVVIIPDYTLLVEDEPVLVLDAKAPTEPVTRSRHVEQAYSYAIHPEIRCRHFALCNGRDLVVHAVDVAEPVLHIRVKDIDARWEDVVEALGPRFLKDPELRDFFPDFGVTVSRLGIDPLLEHLFSGYYLQNLLRVSEALYTASATAVVGSLECLVAFDFTQEVLAALLAPLPPRLASAIRGHLSQQPYEALLGGRLVFSCKAVLAQAVQGPYETFIPFLVTAIEAARYDPTLELDPRLPRPSKGV